MSWLPELLAGPGVNFNSGRRGKTAVLSEGAGVQGAAASDRGRHGPNCGQRVQHQRRLSRVRRAGIGCRPTLGYGRVLRIGVGHPIVHGTMYTPLAGWQGNSRSNPEALRRRVENLLMAN
jgi:hypothetical protein